MEQTKDWFYDESSHAGINYSQNKNAAVYDDQMESIRDYENEVKEFLKKLDAPEPENLTLVDIGCGTGAFTICAARHFKKVYAVDISAEMLKLAEEKARAENIGNIEFCNSGFLKFQPSEKVDAVFTRLAFHHLPDYWKQAALLNMNKMLKQGGILFLSDVVFKFDPDYEKSIESLLSELSEHFSEDLLEETKVHIREEYSTFDWVIQGMLERAGFKIEYFNTENCVSSEFLCRKIKSVEELC